MLIASNPSNMAIKAEVAAVSVKTHLCKKVIPHVLVYLLFILVSYPYSDTAVAACVAAVSVKIIVANKYM